MGNVEALFLANQETGLEAKGEDTNIGLCCLENIKQGRHRMKQVLTFECTKTSNMFSKP
jgi:hypothetical protein